MLRQAKGGHEESLCDCLGWDTRESIQKVFTETIDYRETTVNAKNIYSGAREIYQWLKTFVFPEVLGSILSIDSLQPSVTSMFSPMFSVLCRYQACAWSTDTHARKTLRHIK